MVELLRAGYLEATGVGAAARPPVAAVGLDVCTLKVGLWSSASIAASSSGAGIGIGIVRR